MSMRINFIFILCLLIVLLVIVDILVSRNSDDEKSTNRISFEDVLNRLNMNEDDFVEIPVEYGKTTSDLFGYAIDSNQNGNRVVVSAILHSVESKSQTGVTHIYEYNSNTHEMERIGQELIGEESYDNSGDRVSMNNKGDIVAISASYNDNNMNTNAGHVRVYKYDTSKKLWVIMGGDIDGIDSNDKFGFNMVLSDDGYVLAATSHIGASLYRVDVFQYQEGFNTWESYGNSFQCESIISMKLTSAGKKLVILTGNNVIIYEYQSSPGSWQEIGTIQFTTQNQYFHLTVSDDAKMIGIGSSSIFNGVGQVLIYKHTYNGQAHTWTVKHILGTPAATMTSDNFGQGLSINNSGTTIVVNDNKYIYVFVQENNEYVLKKTIRHELLLTTGYKSVVSGDGRSFIFSNEYDNNNIGTVRSYKRMDDVFAVFD